METAFAHIGDLRPKPDKVDDRPVRGENADGIALLRQFETGVEIRPVRAVLASLPVRPYKEVTPWRHGVTLRDPELGPVGQARAKVEPGQVGGCVAGIVDFKPVLKIVVGRISQRRQVVSHPLIDEERQRRRGVIVGSTRRGEIEDLPGTGMAVRVRAVRTIGRESGVVHVIEHCGL